MTREQAVAGLISRIKRDQGYLAYRKACHRKTNYDDQVQQDMLAFALAAVLLEEADVRGGGLKGSSSSLSHLPSSAPSSPL